jgi:hypothetical protein
MLWEWQSTAFDRCVTGHYCNRVAGEVREVVTEAGVPKDTQTGTEEAQLRFLPN